VWVAIAVGTLAVIGGVMIARRRGENEDEA
jgi:hypothetical protein